MRRLIMLTALALVFATATAACTNLVCSPGATADGSTFVTYTCDGEFHPTLRRIEAADHEPGARQEIRHWNGEVMGEVPYPAHTWAVVKPWRVSCSSSMACRSSRVIAVFGSKG